MAISLKVRTGAKIEVISRRNCVEVGRPASINAGSLLDPDRRLDDIEGVVAELLEAREHIREDNSRGRRTLSVGETFDMGVAELRAEPVELLFAL